MDDCQDEYSNETPADKISRENRQATAGDIVASINRATEQLRKARVPKPSPEQITAMNFENMTSAKELGAIIGNGRVEPKIRKTLARKSFERRLRREQ